MRQSLPVSLALFLDYSNNQMFKIHSHFDETFHVIYPLALGMGVNNRKYKQLFIVIFVN